MVEPRLPDHMESGSVCTRPWAHQGLVVRSHYKQIAGENLFEHHFLLDPCAVLTMHRGQASGLCHAVRTDGERVRLGAELDGNSRRAMLGLE